MSTSIHPAPALAELVEVVVAPEDAPDMARRLLAAAGEDHRQVVTGGLGAFYVPAALARAAGLAPIEDTEDTEAATEAAAEGTAAAAAEDKPAKPAAAKRGNR